MTNPVRYILPNGIPVIIQEHRAADVAALQLWVRAGARDEAQDELGLAHYLEHMLFKGTATRPPGFVEREVEAVGGRINAGTSWDYTFYHTVVPARNAAGAIEMLADVAVNASLEERTARGREAGGARGDAAQRGQPATLSRPAALFRLPSRAIPTAGR